MYLGKSLVIHLTYSNFCSPGLKSSSKHHNISMIPTLYKMILFLLRISHNGSIIAQNLFPLSGEHVLGSYNKSMPAGQLVPESAFI